ncbi:12804_t:CDS:2, partial [Ambispora gerdemannii]
ATIPTNGKTPNPPKIQEGEAIAQEITQLLALNPTQYQRLLFYEITPRNIQEALNNPLPLNKDLVEAQVSRQILDRMIGFCLSTILQKKIHALSAGRVQSVVLKLVVERELLLRKYEKKKDYIICGICQLNEQKITLKQKKEKGINVQGAHEAIHPTYLDYYPQEIKSSLTPAEHQLYKLIFNHTLASLMSPAQVNKITYSFLNNNYYFATSERICQFAGFLACAPEFYFPNYNVRLKSELENITQLEAQKIEIQEYMDKKPVRYNEGSLVQELEKLGIGRPSTYNTFGRLLIKRGYVELDPKGHFIPTELGFSVNN